MRDYPNAQLLTQIYFGIDRSRYKQRVKYDICWNKLKPLKLEDSNDFAFHYTSKYVSDDKEEFNPANMIEVPEE